MKLADVEFLWGKSPVKPHAVQYVFDLAVVGPADPLPLKQNNRLAESETVENSDVSGCLSHPTVSGLGRNAVSSVSVGRAMTARSDRKSDRELLLKVIDSLHVSKSNLRRDPCGDWNIVGRCGHISTDGAGNLQIYLLLETKRRWEITKRNLSFAAVMQDGDAEGVLKMSELPSAAQAAALRKALGLRKVSPLTEGQRTVLRRFSFDRDKTALSGQIIAVTGGGGYPPSQEVRRHAPPLAPEKSRADGQVGRAGSQSFSSQSYRHLHQKRNGG